MLGVLVYIIYLFLGILLADIMFDKKRPLLKFWAGLVVGTVLLMWSNVPFSFIFGFTIVSHVLGLLSSIAIYALLFFFKSKRSEDFHIKSYISFFKSRWFVPLEKSEKSFLIIISGLMVYSLICLLNHTIYEFEVPYG